jgi:hypothetical protein
MCHGGGTTVSILRGQSPGWLTSNISAVNYGFFYWAIFSNDFLFNIMEALPRSIVDTFLISGYAATKAFAIIDSGVDGVRFGQLGPDKYAAQVILGTLAGCGGGLWTGAFRLNTHNWAFTMPAVFENPNYEMKAAFYTTLLYIFTTTPELYPEAFKAYAPILIDIEDARSWSVIFFTSMMLGKHAYELATEGGGKTSLEKVDTEKKEN